MLNLWDDRRMNRVTRGDRCENIDWLSRIFRTAWGKGGDRQVLEYGIELAEGLSAWDHWLDAQVHYN